MKIAQDFTCILAMLETKVNKVDKQLTVVKITIKKNLTQGGYSYRNSAAGPFTTDYLVRSDASFPSDRLQEYAKNIAIAESRLYPATVRFEGAIVKLATPGASAESLRRQFSVVSLEKMTGQLKFAENETLAFPTVTAIYGRCAQFGRHGRLLLPHALTSSEWNLYVHQRTVPSRYQRPNDHSYTPFSDDLMEAIRGANGEYVMSGGEGDSEASLRRIDGFFLHGFEVATIRKKKKKAAPGSKRTGVGRASLDTNETGEAGGTAKPSAGTKAAVPGVVYLLQAGQHFKIGKSIDFEKRLGQIKLQLPYPVEVVHVILAANPSHVESHWHRRFAPSRRNGEWFELTPSEVAEFKSVSSM